jgi:mycofactocin precursor
MRKSRSGLPPRTTEPSSRYVVEAAGCSVNEPGSGVVRRSGAGRSAGRSGVAEAVTSQFWQCPTADRLGLCPEEVGMLAEVAEDQGVVDVADVEDVSAEDIDELLVEEVSIDGMCGVY